MVEGLGQPPDLGLQIMTGVGETKVHSDLKLHGPDFRRVGLDLKTHVEIGRFLVLIGSQKLPELEGFVQVLARSNDRAEAILLYIYALLLEDVSLLGSKAHRNDQEALA